MPVCAWPEASDFDGGPCPFLGAALDSVVEATASFDGLRSPSVELIVALDGPAHRVREHVEEWSERNSFPVKVIECEKAETCTWGNRQRNYVLDNHVATGGLIVWQDQDDEFYPNALTQVLATAEQNPGHPMVFKMMLYHWDPPGELWIQAGRVAHAEVGGHMLVVPNVPAHIARWEPETQHDADFMFIKQTLDRFKAAGHEAVWSELFISMLRPYLMYT